MAATRMVFWIVLTMPEISSWYWTIRTRRRAFERWTRLSLRGYYVNLGEGKLGHDPKHTMPMVLVKIMTTENWNWDYKSWLTISHINNLVLRIYPCQILKLRVQLFIRGRFLLLNDCFSSNGRCLAFLVTTSFLMIEKNYL